jgi:hypothetical protein
MTPMAACCICNVNRLVLVCVSVESVSSQARDTVTPEALGYSQFIHVFLFSSFFALYNSATQELDLYKSD